MLVSAVSTMFPSWSTTRSITWGVTRFPPLAMAAAAVIMCRGVMEKFCPKDSTARSEGVLIRSVTLWNRVTASPGRSIPVLSVKPKASRYLAKVSPQQLADVDGIGLQELHRPSRKVSRPWPVVRQQLMG